jgi:hypothetical protein
VLQVVELADHALRSAKCAGKHNFQIASLAQ